MAHTISVTIPIDGMRYMSIAHYICHSKHLPATAHASSLPAVCLLMTLYLPTMSLPRPISQPLAMFREVIYLEILDLPQVATMMPTLRPTQEH